MDSPNMVNARAYATATVVVVLLLVIGVYVWYEWPGLWNEFSWGGGQKVQFTPSAGGTVAGLRFKDCVFTTKNPAGVTASWNVSSVLNGMSAAYDLPVTQDFNVLKIGGSGLTPLNPFTFRKKGFNDTVTVPTKTASALWAAVPPAATTLTGKVRNFASRK
jgi:hypothetical protein